MYRFRIYTKPRGKYKAITYYGAHISERSANEMSMNEFSEILDFSPVTIKCDDPICVRGIMKAMLMSYGRTGKKPSIRAIGAVKPDIMQAHEEL